jgi:hypothetical protein
MYILVSHPYIVLFFVYEQISLMNGSNISGWLLIMKMKYELDFPLVFIIKVSNMHKFQENYTQIIFPFRFSCMGSIKISFS